MDRGEATRFMDLARHEQWSFFEDYMEREAVRIAQQIASGNSTESDLARLRGRYDELIRMSRILDRAEKRLNED